MKPNERFYLTPGKNGEYFDLKLKNDNGKTHAAVVGMYIPRIIPNPFPQEAGVNERQRQDDLHLVIHNPAEQGDQNAYHYGCEHLDGQNCIPTIQRVNAESPIGTLASAILFLKQHHPVFFEDKVT